MSYTKLKIYYATGGGARHLSVKLSKKVQEYGDKYGYESLSISHFSYFITIRYNNTVLMDRDVIPAGNWPIQSIISYEWIGDDDSKFNPNAVEKPQPKVESKNEEGKVAIGKEAFPNEAKITYVGKPKELLFIVSKDAATAKITGVGERFKNQSKFVIPTQVEEDGKTFRVTEIADAAFSNSSALTSITISEGVVRIGKLAFANCPRLTSITIPKTVTQIDCGGMYIGDNYYSGHLFTNCPSLTSIVVEEGNPRYKSIQNGNGIIDKTTNTLIAGDQTTIIPDSVTSIGNYAFASCDALTSITIPNSVTSIGEFAFFSCDALTSITIPNSVTSIGNRAFFSCDALTSITIPNSVTSIGNRAFYDCHALTSITIPNSVTSIGEFAFGSCDKLTSVTIGNSANNIIGAGLGASPSLTSINVDVNNPNYCSIDGVLFDKNQTTLIRYPRGKQGAYIIPNSVTSIGESAFRNCDALTSITIPDSVTSIGESAFRNCDALTSVTIPDSVTSIGGCAFFDCDALTSVTIPNSVTSIGGSAFYFCKALTSVTIGNSVTSIGKCAFCDCDALTSVTIPNSVTSIGDNAFNDCNALTSVTIENEKGKVAIGADAFPSNAKINYPTLLTKLLKLLKYFNKK